MGDHLRLGTAIRLLCIPTLYMYMEDMTVATVRFLILPLSPKSILAFYASDSHIQLSLIPYRIGSTRIRFQLKQMESSPYNWKTTAS